MSILVTSGDERTAPNYSDSSIGTPGWAGKAEQEFTEDDKRSLRNFIVTEAPRRGNNDCKNGDLEAGSSPFSPAFLSGWPHQLWVEQYAAGAESYRLWQKI